MSQSRGLVHGVKAIKRVILFARDGNSDRVIGEKRVSSKALKGKSISQRATGRAGRKTYDVRA